jgi:hypothetical protein
MNTNCLPNFKAHYSHGGMMPKQSLEKIYSMLRNITGEGGITVTSDYGRGIRIKGGIAADSTTWSFSCSVSGSTCTITEGIIQLGAVSYEVPQGTVTLTGATEYVYIYHMKDHSASGFGHSSSIPNSAGDEWRFILVKFASSGTTWTEVWTGHKGNIILAAPTA